jgi:uncharacterized surface protein with fasciclin (FAS1) repeats
MAQMLVLSRRQAIQTSLLSAIFAFALHKAFAENSSADQDAWSFLKDDPRFSDAVQLIRYAGLVQYVKTDNFTAFLPTNAAFDKYPTVMPTLLQGGHSRAFPDTSRAVEFLRSHALTDLHPLSEFSGRNVTLTAMSGNPIEIDGTQPGIYTVTWTSLQSKIATARVVDTPIVTKNAVIYPVDTVVLTEKM